MPGTRVATIVQISDLHFGDINSRGEVIYDGGMETLWTLLPTFRGLAGHQYEALPHLQQFFDRIKQEDPNVCLFITGDLTSTGKISQFNTVERFVCGRLPPEQGFTGLDTGPWLELAMSGDRSPHRNQAIPGNHDHWPGSYRALGPPPSTMRDWAGNFPFISDTKLHLEGTP